MVLLNILFYQHLSQNNDTRRMTFFGLDIDISLWYILELIRLEHFNKAY